MADLARIEGAAIRPNTDKHGVPLCGLATCSHFTGVECELVPGDVMATTSVCRPAVMAMALEKDRMVARLVAARSTPCPTCAVTE